METHELSPFDFLLGDWDLEYHIPKSFMSEAGTDSGKGTFSKILNERFVTFEYSTKSGSAAKGIFAWDEKINAFRYWWFENSGSFCTATCNFISENILAMNWHDTLLVQTFTKEAADRVVLRMQHPSVNGEYELVMEVILRPGFNKNRS